MFRRSFLVVCVAVLGLGGAHAQDAAPAPPPLDPQNTIYLDIPSGRVVIRLRPDLAPKHVERVKQLCRDGFYDGTPFHRVIEGFMAQGGDPTGTGNGGSRYPNLPAEFSTSAHFLRGTVGAARSQDPDSANSQFFIMFAPGASLDGNYTIWGNVVSGMENVDKIKRGNPDDNGKVDDPDRIIHMRVAADVNNRIGFYHMSDDAENTLYLDLKSGRVTIQLRPDLAPKHVERVKMLAREGFYDGTPFHRVIEGFMAQGGDPTGTGTSGSKYGNLPAEFSRTAKFVRGTVGAARTGDPNSANSQFYIMFAPAPHLDGQYTVWGQVTDGMEHIDQIKRGSGGSGSVSNPDKILKASLAADAGAAEG